MKRFYILAAVMLCAIFSANAQDLIVLKNGSFIEAKVMEISTTEIRYKRFNHLDGPMIVVPIADVLSIRYENGKAEIFNESANAQRPAQTQPQTQTQTQTQTQQQTQTQPLTQTETSQFQTHGILPLELQTIWNSLPAITIAGNNLKLEFMGET